MSFSRIRLTVIFASLLVFGALFALAVVPGSVAASDDVEIGIEDPGDIEEDDLPITVDLNANNVDPDEGIGAFQVNITTDDVDIDSIEHEGPFEIEWSERDDGVVTVVGYAGDISDTQGQSGLTLAELTITGDVTDEAELAVDEVMELVDPEDAEDIDFDVADPVTFEIEEDVEDDDDDDPAPSPPSTPTPDDPTAAFDFEPEEPVVNENVTFNASGSEPGEDEIVGFEWDINGEEFDGEVVNTSFNETGEYDVELTIENDEDRTDTATETITVEEDVPERPEPPEDAPEPQELDDDEISDRVAVPDDVTPVRGEAAEVFEQQATFSNASAARNVVFGDNDVVGEVTAVEYESESADTGSSPGITASVTQFSVPDANQSATVTFAISTDRLDDIDATADELQINRFDDGWEALDTTIEEEDDEVFVTAETPGFSWFSVSAVSSPEAAIDIDPEEPVAGQEVTFDGSDSEPGEDEIVSFDWDIDGETYEGETVTEAFNEPGEYEAELTVENDEGRSDTTTETFEVVETYELTVEVENEAGDAIEGADVTVDGESATTDADGTVAFELPEDTYTVEADAEGYDTATQDVTLDADETLTMTLAEEPEAYDLTVEVEDENGDTIEDATVEVDGDEATTADDGAVTFTELEPDTYTIDVEADGFEPASEEVEIDDDETLTIELTEEDDGIGVVGLLLLGLVLALLGAGAVYYYAKQQS